MFRYFDAHSHIHGKEYDLDRAEVLSRMREAQVGTITVGTHLETSREAAELAKNEPDVWAAVGLHPTDTTEDFNPDEYREFLKNPKVVAIGECGLDYFRLGENAENEKGRQKKNFLSQLEFAKNANLPLMIHCRPSGKTMDAHEDMLAILNSYFINHKSSLRGNIHFFTGTEDIAKRYVELGFSVSFPGVVTFTDEYEGVINGCPEQNILSETDAPYATPTPFRGKRNEPTYVIETVKKLAEVRGVSLEQFSKVLVENVSRVFNIRLS